MFDFTIIAMDIFVFRTGRISILTTDDIISKRRFIIATLLHYILSSASIDIAILPVLHTISLVIQSTSEASFSNASRFDDGWLLIIEINIISCCVDFFRYRKWDFFS